MELVNRGYEELCKSTVNLTADKPTRGVAQIFNGWIDDESLLALGEALAKNAYGRYLKELLQDGAAGSAENA